jgi:hypothetical protein
MYAFHDAALRRKLRTPRFVADLEVVSVAGFTIVLAVVAATDLR